jgi:hypothetical protein
MLFFLLLHAGAAGLQLLGGALGDLLPFAKRRKGVARCPAMGAGGFRTVPNQRVGPGAAGGSCVNETDMFQQCVRNTGGDVSACQAYLDMLTNCKRSACPTQSRTSRSSAGIFRWHLYARLSQTWFIFSWPHGCPLTATHTFAVAA